MVEIPILPETEILRGDILTIGGSTRHVDAAVAALGHADRPVESTDLAVVSRRHRHRRPRRRAELRCAGGIPISLSTSGGALLAGLLLGYLRTIRPTFGNIPAPALVADEHARPQRLHRHRRHQRRARASSPGLQQVGVSLFLWGMVATTMPLVAAVLLGHYVFKFHPAILFGVCAGVRTTTAALGMIQEAAKSKVPALGYGMPYAIGNTLLTIFGMVIVLMMAARLMT